jgi:predicted nuclease of predicted toxin-antitoxin system
MGFESIHVNDILNKSNTKDSDICKFADAKDYIVITKDHDFQKSYIIKQSPKKLLKINLGNISNQLLISLFLKNISFLNTLKSQESFFVVINEEGFNHQ